jgi:NADH dehydrogenase FAD-containing subunit
LIPPLGAVGVEFSGKIKALYPEAQVTLIHSGEALLSREPLPERFKSRVFELLQEQGVDVLLCERPTVTAVGERAFLVKLNSGRCMSVGSVVWAALKRSLSTGFVPQSLLNADGSIKIDAQWVYLPTKPFFLLL